MIWAVKLDFPGRAGASCEERLGRLVKEEAR